LPCGRNVADYWIVFVRGLSTAGNDAVGDLILVPEIAKLRLG